MSHEIAEHYMKEERVAMKKRFLSNKQRTKSILRRMKKDSISSKENIATLASDLSEYHNEPAFLDMKNMGDILTRHLEEKLKVKVF